MDTKHTKETICLVPFGKIDMDLLKNLIDPLVRLFPLKHKIMPPVTIPSFAYDATRKQYQSSYLLDELKSYASPGRRILGVTDCDIFNKKRTFILGDADLLLGIALISMARFHQEWYGLIPDKKRLYRRAQTEAVYQTGLTYGLPPCSDPYCLMYKSTSPVDVDRKTDRFCQRCRNLLKQ